MAAFQTRRARVHTTFCSWVAGATDDCKLDNRLSRAFKNRDVRDIDNSDRRRERRIDILKVDVEGWELNVLAGLEKTIMSSKKITIFCEYNPSAQECAGRTPRELLDWFLDRQFALSYPRNGELHALPPAMIDQFAETLGPQGYTTVFAQRV